MHFSIENIRRWQWVVMALVIGGVIGVVRQLYPDDLVSRYRLTSTDRDEFERALTEQVDGTARLSELFVYPAEVPGSGEKLDIVIGRYLHVKENQWVADAKCYVFEVPYREGAAASVRDYLDGKDISYRYAWWHRPGVAVGMWMIGSLIVIGGIWPTVVNLVAYGQIRRPKGEGFDVGKRSGIASRPSRPALSEEELARVAALAGTLEEELRKGAGGAGDAPAELVVDAPVRTLENGPLELAPVERPEEEREFGADQDDYYPTERHGPRKG